MSGITENTWITPIEAGLMVASHYGPKAIADGKPATQLLDWVSGGRVASMAGEVLIHAPGLPLSGDREVNYLIAPEEWQLARSSGNDFSKLYTSAEVSFFCADEKKVVSQVTLAEIRFLKEDVLRRIAGAGWPISDHSNHRQASPRPDDVLPIDAVGAGHGAAVKTSRGRLPPNASAANRRDEEYAHLAADLVRSGKKLSEALRIVAPHDPMRASTSVERAIRLTFGLMYDAAGNPF